MSSDFTDSFIEDSAQLSYEPRLSSQRFDSARFESFPDYTESESSMREGGLEEDLPPSGSGVAEVISHGGELSGNEAIIQPAVEGFALREWRRQNSIRLEEKERREKEIVKQIIEEADEYKAEYYKKWKIRCENSREVNREKEKLFVEGREKFHVEADNSYWKAIAELVTKEIPTIEKKGKKEKINPSIVVIQGPKPGKPTDLSRMRQILVKLKHKTPLPHEPGKDAKPQETAPPAASASTSAVAK